MMMMMMMIMEDKKRRRMRAAGPHKGRWQHFPGKAGKLFLLMNMNA